MLQIEAETERAILDAENASGEAENFSRLVIEGGGEIGVGVMSFEKWLETKGSHSVKDGLGWHQGAAWIN